MRNGNCPMVNGTYSFSLIMVRVPFKQLRVADNMGARGKNRRNRGFFITYSLGSYKSKDLSRLVSLKVETVQDLTRKQSGLN